MSLVLKKRRLCSIDNKGCSEFTVSRESNWDMGLEIEGHSNIQQVLVFPFNYRVLLWSIYIEKLMQHSLLIEEIYET